MTARRAAALLTIGLLLALAPELRAQCAMCQTALTGSAEGRAVSPALNDAILLLLAAPYAVFGTLLAVVFRRRIAEWLRGVSGRPALLPERSTP